MSPPSAQTNSHPTRARHTLLLLLGSLTFILYLDRVCIGQSASAIMQDLGISDGAMGWIFGAFTIAYGLFEVQTGSWGDRFGSRRILTRIVLWWSAFTILTGCVPAFSWPIESWLGLDGFWPSRGWVLAIDSFLVLIIVRFLFGAGEAGALPNTARIVARWYPLRERALAQGTVLTCMLVGGAASPYLAGMIITSFGWRWAFLGFGSVGIFWAFAFYRWFRDDPAEHPSVNAAELQLITSESQARPSHAGHPPIPWSFVLASSNVWLLGGIISCAAFAAYFYTYWFPRYLEDGRGVATQDSGGLSALVMAGGACGALLGSVLGAWVDRIQFDTRWKRNLVGCGLMGSAAICLAVSVTCDTPRGTIIWVLLAFGLAQAQQATWWSVVADISGKHLGAMFGLLNSLGVPGAFLSNILTGLFVEHRKTTGLSGRDAWDPVIWCYAIILALGGVLWLFVDARRSAVEPDEETAEALLSGKAVPLLPGDPVPEPAG